MITLVLVLRHSSETFSNLPSDWQAGFVKNQNGCWISVSLMCCLKQKEKREFQTLACLNEVLMDLENENDWSSYA